MTEEQQAFFEYAKALADYKNTRDLVRYYYELEDLMEIDRDEYVEKRGRDHLGLKTAIRRAWNARRKALRWKGGLHD